MGQKQKTKQVIMTEGVIWKQLLAFSMPLLVGNLFQQLYNTVDSIVVGNFIGSEALAAVGSSNSLINLIIGMFMGIATGAGVIISQYYGAKDEQKLHWAVHTCMALSLIGGALLIVLGVLLSPLILRLMGTPEEVMPNSVAYLRIFFCGSLFNLVYNMGAGVLRAVGDSRRPLYYLCVSSVVNIILDMVFVVVFRMGTAGVGYATVIAQAVSSVLTVRALMKTEDSYRLVPSRIRIDRRMMKRILKLGIPSGIQQSIISLSNVIVQANINGYGAAAMAGYGAYSKVDGFAMLPLQSFCMASTTFTGQNIGAKKARRVKDRHVSGDCHQPDLYGLYFCCPLFECGQDSPHLLTGSYGYRLRAHHHGHPASVLLVHRDPPDPDGKYPRKRKNHGYHVDRRWKHVYPAHDIY